MEGILFNYKKIKIRPTILWVIGLLVGLTSLVSLSLQYYFLKDLAFSSTQKIITQTYEETQKEVKRIDEVSKDLLSILELTYGIGKYPNSDIQPTLIKKATTALVNKNYIYSIYVGYDNNSFYEVINLNIHDELRKKYNAKEKDRWLVVKIFTKDNKKVQLEQFLDEDLKLTRYKLEDATYQPTVRPWYKKAIKTDEIIKTSPYMFANLGNYGITYAKKLSNNKAVMGLDISLKSLSNFLKEHENIEGTRLYLFDEKKSIIASNIQNHLKEDELRDILNSSMNQEGKLLTIKKKEYFVSSVEILTSENEKEYLTILIPEAQIMKESNKKILYATIVATIILLLILPVIWYATRIITDPIKELEKENKKIRKRKYDKVKQLKTPIKEIYDLSKSLVGMSQSIKEYELAQIKLFDSVVELIATTIDAKSKYTAGHCERVPTLTLMMAEAATKSKDSIFKGFELTKEDEIRELSIAAWLHDCGKVTTPIHVVDKATKLETIYNRIHEIRTRFEVVHRDLQIQALNRIINNENKDEVNTWLKEAQTKLIEDFEFIAKANVGAEFMKDEDKQRVKEIAQTTWTRNFDNTLGLSQDEENRLKNSDSKVEYILEDRESHVIPRPNEEFQDYDKYGFKVNIPNNLFNFGEIYNLTIDRGTLTEEERFKINEHVIMSIKMLENLPLPDYLKKVPEYAGAHHETLIGTGYPRKLTKEDMSIPARIMAVADVFEALTAADRPYKKPKTLSESIRILSFMVKDQHLDADIFKLFLESGIYLEYGKKYLNKEQIDEVNISDYL